MSNVIPITHSKLQIISIKGRSSSVSPLKDKDNSLNNRTQEQQSMIRPSITLSDIYYTENNDSMTNHSSKKKIMLKKNRNDKCNDTDNRFQSNKKFYYVSLLRQTPQKSINSKQYLRISIDLDKLVSQEKTIRKQTLGTDVNDLNKNHPKMMNYQSENIDKSLTKIEKEDETKQESNIFATVNLKQTSTLKKPPRRKYSCKEIKARIFNKNQNKTRNPYRSKSHDTVLRNAKPQNQKIKDENDKQKIVNKKQSNIVASILTEQQTLKALFKKLTKKNLPYQNWINYLNLTYEELTIDELHFIGILLQRVQPKYLNAMDYLTFKFKIYQNCQKEFQELMHFQQLKG